MIDLLSRFRRRDLAAAGLTLFLAVGWTARERSFAAEKALLKSGTVTLDQVRMSEFSDRGQIVGKLGVYFDGDTPASSKFVTGRCLVDPGRTPHLPHVHPEEEIMVIESGTGEIDVDGKITKVGPGSVMFTTPNVSHGIVNTGPTPMVFTYIKWAGKDSK